MVKHSWQGDMHRTMIEVHKKHGKLVRTGPNEVSVADLSAIKKSTEPVPSLSNHLGIVCGKDTASLISLPNVMKPSTVHNDDS